MQAILPRAAVLTKYKRLVVVARAGGSSDDGSQTNGYLPLNRRILQVGVERS